MDPFSLISVPDSCKIIVFSTHCTFWFRRLDAGDFPFFPENWVVPVWALVFCPPYQVFWPDLPPPNSLVHRKNESLSSQEKTSWETRVRHSEARRSKGLHHTLPWHLGDRRHEDTAFNRDREGVACSPVRTEVHVRTNEAGVSCTVVVAPITGSVPRTSHNTATVFLGKPSVHSK